MQMFESSLTLVTQHILVSQAYEVLFGQCGLGPKRVSALLINQTQGFSNEIVVELN